MTIASGAYTRPSNSFSNPSTGTTIDPTHADALFDDFELAIDTILSLRSQVSAQFDKTADVALANVTGLTVPLAAAKTYSFKATLYTSSNTSGGVKFAIAGTATATAVRFHIDYINDATNAFLINSPENAMAGEAGVTATAAGLCLIHGTITVNAAGTLTVQFAQNASNAAASSVLVGSTFVAEKIA